MFQSLGKLSDLPKKEEEILRFWKERSIFEKSLKNRENSPSFVFYEGPPTTNGYPHAGHVIGRSLKDLIPRYKTMCGYYVPRRAGWDTHGLPVELEVEKSLGISGKGEIETYGLENFNAKCKESVFKYIREWERLTERLGVWMDLERPYITCSNDYIETVWWMLKSLWEKDLLYQGYKVLPYCARCGTSLSSHEVALGYKEVEDPAIYVKFKIKGEEKRFLLVWTTTPWTLVANVALAVGEEMLYSEVEDLNTSEYFILAKDRVETLFGEKNFRVVREYKGKELVGMEYEPLMPFLRAEKGYQVFSGEFVTVEEGTGIVHIAPAFGEDDMQMAQRYGLSVLHPVESDGRYDERVIPWKNMWVKDADPFIIEYLRKEGKLFRREIYRHSYPFCWRCDTPLLYYAKESWFIRTTAFKESLLENNRQIHWYPEHIREGRFGDFLENVVDWALSRERYWGTPLNIWKCTGCGFQEAIGSVQELKERSRETIVDIELHRPYVDRIIFQCPSCGGDMKRVPEVIDCWFDSGAMFAAQLHYPFENKETFPKHFPADFICEAIDQTRGWFYSLHVLATILFQSPAYRNCLVTELGLDEKGQKMSKHVGNVVSPWDLMERYGADVLRWYVFSVSPPWVPKRFGQVALGEVFSKFFDTLWNVSNFFILYANIDRFVPSGSLPFEMRNLFDRWLLSRFYQLVEKVRVFMDGFEVSKAAKAIEDFVVEDLSNWYIRRSRRRFWKSAWDEGKASAYETLYEVLVGLAKLCAPFIPFVSEILYGNLTGPLGREKESVHLEDYPVVRRDQIDSDLLRSMELARKLTALGRAVRSKVNIKLRQPLRKAILLVPKEEERRLVFPLADLIREELNVKELEWVKHLPESVDVKLRPRFAVLGPRYGKKVKEIARYLAECDTSKGRSFLEKGFLSVMLGEEEIVLGKEEIEIILRPREGFSVESDEGHAVVMDTKLDQELQEEGIIRDFIHTVQLVRKESGFEVEDRIELCLFSGTDPAFTDILEKYKSLVQEEVLAETVLVQEEEFEKEAVKDCHLDGKRILFALRRRS
ncbi:MAG: isoleucine--tRNA ligase [Candidatus Caldatribacteriaceae bacterium]